VNPFEVLWRWLTEPLPIEDGAREKVKRFGGVYRDEAKPAPSDVISPGIPQQPRPDDDPATEECLRELMGLALSTPTPDAIMAFVDFASRMKRLAPYNLYMVFAQRPGAQAVASTEEWHRFGQRVCVDAIPILILRPKGPISRVYELADTLPAQDRDPRYDSFGVDGKFDEARLKKLIDALGSISKRKLRVEVVEEDFGGAYAGQIARIGLFNPGEPGDQLGAPNYNETIGKLSQATHWRIKLNRRQTRAEQFATLLHEIGHLFCGHVGAFEADNPSADEYGWPDRHNLPHAVREIEAELVAWHMCEREGLATGSPLYLRPYLEAAGDVLAQVDLDRVIRAIARIRSYLGDPSPQLELFG
jgi:hypothetical protein